MFLNFFCLWTTCIPKYCNLVEKHFPREHKFHKTFNRNNIKVSYSCMPNIKSAINSHNRKILHPPVNSQSRTCNCIKKTDCPLQEICLSENTLYQAEISSENFQTKIYTTYQKQNLKQDFRSIKNPSITKSIKMTHNYRMNSGTLKLQKKSQS